MPLQWGRESEPEEESHCDLDEHPENYFGFDLSGETELLEKHRRVHETRARLDDYFDRVDAYLKKLDVVDKINERLRKAMKIAKEHTTMATLERLLNGDPEKFRSFTKRADPLMLMQVMQNAAESVEKASTQLIGAIEPLSVQVGSDTALALIRPAFVAVLKLKQEMLLALGDYTLTTFSRIAEGVPDWDYEQGCPIPGTVPFATPPMEEVLGEKPGQKPGENAPAQSSAATQQTIEDEQALLARLLNGLNF